MALPVAAAVAGGAAVAAYLDARFLIRHDLSIGSQAQLITGGMQFMMDRYARDRMLVYHILEEQATGVNANRIFLIFEDRQWTYKEFFDALQPVGNWLMNDLGIQREEMVALNGGNSAEYLLLWFALEGIGASTAFINCNLTAAPLIHCAKLCNARYMLTDSSVKPLVQPCEDDLKAANIQTIYYDQQFILSFKDTTPLPQSRRSGFRPDQIAGLIYTSGTTGMPKGTILTRGREIFLTQSPAKPLGLKPTDRMYTALPLYHGAAHGLCITPIIGTGASVVLSRKFSHKTFWPEVRASKANILQYVGELCRYLVNAPPSPQDKNHNVTMAWGNGMRPDVWETFRQRFGIECINELYAATDGMGSSFNANRGPFARNAIARRGLLWHYFNGNNEKRVRMDVVTEDILRDPKTGLAIEAKVGEPGEVLHRLDPKNPDVGFSGYFNNKAAGDKRKISDVFEKGDLWFRSGDMMRLDSDGCLYFVDRLGDTFRWHSENVSTNEVSDVVGEWPQIAETNVYGVLVPHADGRAGCAAVVPHPDFAGSNLSKFDFKGLAEHLTKTLPKYAVPLFLRISKELEYTGTMKLQKGRLRNEGVDLDKIALTAKEKSVDVDLMYWLPPGKREYVPFGRKEWDELKGGKVRL